MARKTLYLIDGHAQIYRAYYAPFAQLTSPRGEPTRAIHVFTQMILNLLRDKKPDYLAVTLDVGDESVFRVEIDPEYKAHRDPAPEDLPPQIERIVTILEKMEIPILRMKRYEADDIMATLCARHAGPDCDVYLVSRDKDLDQLLTDHVRMYDPGKDRVIDAAAVLAEKGYGPDLAVEAQMLMGDSTDNIKGVVGIGPKKAADLLKKYGSVQSIIDHADELTPKMRENVLAFRERQDTVRKLVTLLPDVPIDFDLAAADVSRFKPSAAAALLDELGLRRLLDRVADKTAQAPTDSPRPDEPHASVEDPPRRASGSVKSDVAPDQSSNRPPAKQKTKQPIDPQGSLFGGDDDTATDDGDTASTSIQSVTGDYHLIDTTQALRELAEKLAAVKSFAFDTETRADNPDWAVRPSYADMVGISIAWEPGKAYYIPVRGLGRTVPLEAVREHLGPIFANPSIRKCGQNVKFDMVVLHGAGIKVAGVDFDTMLASFVQDSSRRSHGIDGLAAEVLGFRKISTEDVIGAGRKQIRFDEVPIERVSTYACEDADVAWRLREALEKRFTEPELLALFRDVEMPLVSVLAEMEYRGVALDTDLLAKISGQMADRQADLEREIHDIAGRPFNLNSTQQLAEILFDVRKLRVVKHTKTGRSTDAEVLDTLAAETDDPIPKLLLEYRELTKLKGTYVDALPEMVHPRTNRIHPIFHQTGAVTGRLSCSEPNLQNIPIRTEVGAQIRRAFVPGAADCVLLKADYSQIELRVLAHFCGDEALSAAFRDDRDIHAFVASQIHSIPLDAVTKDQRAQAKTVNFGIIYGQSAFGLARQTGMPVTEAREFIDRYFARYPKIRGFLDSCVAHAKRHGYVKTLLGRRRTIADIASRNQTARNAAERLAVNTVVQGTAADMIKLAMIRIHRRIEKENRPSRMLIQVHDELVFETPIASVEQEAAMIRDEMSAALPIGVPVKVDVGWGKNWLDAGGA
ncbi:MAG: DNA polymerase I [Planctomycetes bacterium]|nr:DNA polymerase I [Planctomycetota bacterium]